MELGISGRYALITGGANGIGKSITEAFVNEGVNVIFTSRDQKSIDDITSRFRGPTLVGQFEGFAVVE